MIFTKPCDLGAYVNLIAAVLVFIVVLIRIKNKVYSVNDLFSAFCHHFMVLLGMLCIGGFIVAFLYLFNLTMMWYAMPELVFLLYILPMINIGLWIHSCVAFKRYKVLLSIFL